MDKLCIEIFIFLCRACLVRPTSFTSSSAGLNSTTSSSSTSTSSSGGGGKYVCTVCKKDFPTNALLNIHAKIHYFERPYRLVSITQLKYLKNYLSVDRSFDIFLTRFIQDNSHFHNGKEILCGICR